MKIKLNENNADAFNELLANKDNIESGLLDKFKETINHTMKSKSSVSKVVILDYLKKHTCFGVEITGGDNKPPTVWVAIPYVWNNRYVKIPKQFYSKLEISAKQYLDSVIKQILGISNLSELKEVPVGQSPFNSYERPMKGCSITAYKVLCSDSSNVIEHLKNMDANEALESPQLNNLLKDKFGDKFNYSPKCKEVCDYIKSLIPDVKIVTGFVIGSYDTNSNEFVSYDTGTHYVIDYDNELYDFTNQQYSKYQGYDQSVVDKCPVIFRRCTNYMREELSDVPLIGDSRFILTTADVGLSGLYIVTNKFIKESFNKSNKMILNEDLFDVTVEPDFIPLITLNQSILDNGEVINTEKPEEQTPETSEENGVAKLILHAINGETDTIAEYNDLIANTDNEDIIRIIQDITAEENNHIGMLQKALELISPNASNIDGGMKEAEGMIEEESNLEESVNGYPQDYNEELEEIWDEEGLEFDRDLPYKYWFSSAKQARIALEIAKAFGYRDSWRETACVYLSGYDEDADEYHMPLTEADTLHNKFKKDIKNEYKAWARKQEKTEQNRKDMMDILNDHPEVSDETRKSWMDKIDKMYPNQEFEYDFPNNLEKIDYPFYVTYYAEYPIYEPAEGGYYYAGRDAIWSEGFNTEEEAQEYADKYIEQDDEWNEWKKEDFGYHLDGKYIGQNQYVVIEPKKSYLGMVKGWEPYQ